MSNGPNGNANAGRAPRFRLDQPLAATPAEQGYSGRSLVIWALLVLLGIWALLGVLFLSWRSGYAERVRLGRATVVPAADAFADQVPPGIDRAVWVEAIADTRAMLEKIVRSGLLNVAQMNAFQQELHRRSARVRPETAIVELIQLWNDLERSAGPSLAGTPYPKVLVPAMAIQPLAAKPPPGVDAGQWRMAIDRTRVLLVKLAASGRLNAQEQEDFSRGLSEKVRKANPRTALKVLASIWAQAAAKTPADQVPPRPELLGETAGL